MAGSISGNCFARVVPIRRLESLGRGRFERRLRIVFLRIKITEDMSVGCVTDGLSGCALPIACAQSLGLGLGLEIAQTIENSGGE